MSWVQSHPMGRALSYLQREPFVCYNGRLGPIDDFCKGQRPARAEKHRDAASLGGRGVTGGPSPTLHTPTSHFHVSSCCYWGQAAEEKRVLGECGCCAEGEPTMDTGAPESQSKEQLSCHWPGAQRTWRLRSVGGRGWGMLKLGLYLQGLEEAQGIRTAAWDEAEGGVGQRCPRVGPKEAQEACDTAFPHLAPSMTPSPTPTLPDPRLPMHRHSIVSQLPANKHSATHGYTSARGTLAPRPHLKPRVLAPPLPLLVLVTSLLFSGPQFPHLQNGRQWDLTFQGLA